MKRGSPYSEGFYRSIECGSETAARLILPLIIDLVAPRSMIDVGCGDGSWLHVAGELGVERRLGVDGPWGREAGRKIPEDEFRACDLAEPLQEPGYYDLAASLEVAEHLPPSHSAGFVAQLTSLAPVVLFSAAVPGQGGTGHRNECWQDQWAALFDLHDYQVIDVIRPTLWNDVTAEPWYLQNTFLYADRTAVKQSPELEVAAERGLAFPMRVVHPRMLRRVADQPDLTIGENLRRLPAAARTTVSNRLATRRAR